MFNNYILYIVYIYIKLPKGKSYSMIWPIMTLLSPAPRGFVDLVPMAHHTAAAFVNAGPSTMPLVSSTKGRPDRPHQRHPQVPRAPCNRTFPASRAGNEFSLLQLCMLSTTPWPRIHNVTIRDHTCDHQKKSKATPDTCNLILNMGMGFSAK